MIAERFHRINVGETLHRIVERIDDLQDSVRTVAFEGLDDLQQVALSSRREDELAHDAERIFCLSCSKNARPSLNLPASPARRQSRSRGAAR